MSVGFFQSVIASVSQLLVISDHSKSGTDKLDECSTKSSKSIGPAYVLPGILAKLGDRRRSVIERLVNLHTEDDHLLHYGLAKGKG